MAETRGKFNRDFKEGAVRLVRETGRPVAQVARDLGRYSSFASLATSPLRGHAAPTVA